MRLKICHKEADEVVGMTARVFVSSLIKLDRRGCI